MANVVYQGYAGGLGAAAVRQVGQVATDSLSPDCTFLLDMSPSAARARMGDQLDRVESRGEDYRKRLRQGFLQEAQQMGDSVYVVDADRSVDSIQTELRSLATQVLKV